MTEDRSLEQGSRAFLEIRPHQELRERERRDPGLVDNLEPIHLEYRAPEPLQEPGDVEPTLVLGDLPEARNVDVEVLHELLEEREVDPCVIVCEPDTDRFPDRRSRDDQREEEQRSAPRRRRRRALEPDEHPEPEVERAAP